MTYNPHSPENARIEDAVEEATLDVLSEMERAIRDNWPEFIANVLEDARSNAGVYDAPDALFDPDGICTGQDVFQHLGYFKREPAPTGR